MLRGDGFFFVGKNTKQNDKQKLPEYKTKQKLGCLENSSTF